MLSLNQRQKAILVGTILGDGHLEQNGHHVRLRLDQGIKQADYLVWKYDEEIYAKYWYRHYHWRFGLWMMVTSEMIVML